MTATRGSGEMTVISVGSPSGKTLTGIACAPMRSRLGRVAAGTLAGVGLLIGASTAGAGTEPTVPEPDVAPEAVSSTTPTTTTTTTTTTLPPEAAEITGTLTPSRGDQSQVAEILPPPFTTTTLPPAKALPANSGDGRRVVYHKSRQRVWTVEADGTVSKTHLVSGRLTWNQPKAGTYSVFSRSSYTCNINNPNICWRYMVRFTKGPSGDNIGFHEIPTNLSTGAKLQSTSQLGTPLSGGCVRQAPSDALYIWNWAPIGTKVVVIQ